MKKLSKRVSTVYYRIEISEEERLTLLSALRHHTTHTTYSPKACILLDALLEIAKDDET